MVKELIKITENKNGDKLVNARELHEFLENKRQFADWIKQRINQYGFVEGEDFTVHKFVNGKATQIDYAIKVDMAKELSMVENNEKGKIARKYFIQCEKVLKENVQAPKLSKELQAIFVLDNRTVEIEKRIDNIENNLPLLGVDCDEVTKTVHGVGVRLLGSKNSNAYKDKSLRRRVYTDIYGELKRQFQVRSYKAIKRCELSKAIDVINNYKLPLALDSEIFQINNQMSMEVS